MVKNNIDALAKLASMKMPSKNQLVIQLVMLAPSIEVREVTYVDTKDRWMCHDLDY